MSGELIHRQTGGKDYLHRSETYLSVYYINIVHARDRILKFPSEIRISGVVDPFESMGYHLGSYRMMERTLCECFPMHYHVVATA